MSVWGCHSLLDSLNNRLDRLDRPAGRVWNAGTADSRHKLTFTQ